MGPGKYDQKFKLVEGRDDKGAVKMKDPVGIENIEIDERPIIYPNYDIDKPNKLVLKMMPETKIEPQNLPDKILFPEKWEFYDPNLNAIKEVPEVHTFASNLPLER